MAKCRGIIQLAKGGPTVLTTATLAMICEEDDFFTAQDGRLEMHCTIGMVKHSVPKKENCR